MEEFPYILAKEDYCLTIIDAREGEWYKLKDKVFEERPLNQKMLFLNQREFLTTCNQKDGSKGSVVRFEISEELINLLKWTSQTGDQSFTLDRKNSDDDQSQTSGPASSQATSKF